MHRCADMSAGGYDFDDCDWGEERWGVRLRSLVNPGWGGRASPSRPCGWGG